MRQPYTTGYLSERQIERAHVLIAAFAPMVTTAEWREFCLASLANPDRERHARVAVVADSAGYLHGIAIFAVCNEKAGDRYVDVPVFAPLSAADASGVTDELLDFIRRVARQADCDQVHFGSLEPEAWQRYITGNRYGDRGNGIIMML